MRVRVPTEDLEIGMYVVLPFNWLKHPFLLNRFVIKSEKELRALREHVVGDVLVDFDRSSVGPPVGHTPASEPTQVAMQPGSLRALGQEIAAVGADPSLRPEAKAHAVYGHAQTVMRSLFEEPTAEFIGETKDAVGQLVDMVMADEEVATSLLHVSQHDFTTFTHSVNVGIYAVCLAKKFLGTSSNHNMMELGAGFFLHDIGKVRVDSAILNKPGALNAGEWERIQQHPVEGYLMMKETGHLSQECKVIILQHHERADGKGYPYGLKADQIHIYARLCSVADVFDALTSRRPYRSSLPAVKALQLMRDEMLGHFDRDMFESFVSLFGRRNLAAAA